MREKRIQVKTNILTLKSIDKYFVSKVISSFVPYKHFPIRKNLVLPLFILTKLYQVTK